MEKTTMKLKGMHCRSCDMLVKDILEDMGCDDIDVTHKTGDIAFAYDKEKTDLDKIKKELKKEGYDSE